MGVGSGALLCQTEGREPQMNADERKLNEITEKIIGCAFDVANGICGLGCGRSPHGIYPRFNPLPLTLHSGHAPSLIHRAGGVAGAGVTALPNRRKGTADEHR